MDNDTHIRNGKENPASTRRRYKPTMAQQSGIALVLGCSCGLFFGEQAARLKVVGDVYVALMQMMVLPYIILSLIEGLGRLEIKQAGKLLKYAALFLLLIWGVMAGVLFILPFSFPEIESGSYFSSSLLMSPKPINFIDIFIPGNIFESLSEDHLPAIILFCIVFGVFLISAEKKEELFRPMRVLLDAINRGMKLIISLTPIGLFAMTAVAAGTLTFDEIERLQGYFIIQVWMTLLLCFWVLPALTTCFTPFRFRDIVKVSWPAIMLAFAASKMLVALPLIIEGVRELAEKYEFDEKRVAEKLDVLIPIFFPFPATGKLLVLLFLPFAGWYMGSPPPPSEFGLYYPTGLFSLFGNPFVAVPFMLNLLHIPSDMFELFVTSGVICGRLSAGIKSMDLFILTALTLCAVSGRSMIQWRRVIVVAAVTGLLLATGVYSTHTYLRIVFNGAYTGGKVLLSMPLLSKPVRHRIVKPGPNPVLLEPGESRMERIRRTGVIRIGFHEDNMPFSYRNTKGDLVGFDMEMAHDLAREIGVRIEFVPFLLRTLDRQIEDDHFDLAMSGLAGSLDRYGQARFTKPYLSSATALAALDHQREFATLEGIASLGRIRVGIHPGVRREADLIRSRYPSYFSNVEFINLNSYRDFFERKGEDKRLNALFTLAEGGAAWTLIYPMYQIYTPLGNSISLPLVYPHGFDNDCRFTGFLNYWITLKEDDGTIKRAYDYWILGKDAKKKKPRWSIIRNLLHWVN
ncbi:MAG: cation:dicarboxylase symporter family transporter [Proteobacteria bacterium]|nr:cation:dicarboxylase symporter family transporter [Pseudomonadota bacterium]